MQIKKIFPPLLIVVSTMANYCRSIEDFQGRHYIEGEKALQKGDKEDKQALQRDVIRITDLGEFEVSNEYEKPLEQKVKNRLQKLCPGLKLDWITFSVQPFLKQIDILPNSLGSKFYTGRVTLTYTPLVINDSQYIKTHEYKKNLSDIITSYYLGEFDVTNKYAKPSEREVKEMLVKLYPGLNTKEIEVHVYPLLGKIDIFGKGLYTGHVTLRYTQQAKTKRLSDIITSCYLGEFGEKPSGDELLNRLEQLCPILNMNWIRVLRSSTLEQIVILPNELGSKFYTGRVTLTYTTLKTNHSQDPRLEEAYKILGVDENTPYDQIRKAYHKLALKYHPDKHPDASEEEKEKYNNLFNQLKKAWDFVEDH